MAPSEKVKYLGIALDDRGNFGGRIRRTVRRAAN